MAVRQPIEGEERWGLQARDRSRHRLFITSIFNCYGYYEGRVGDLCIIEWENGERVRVHQSEVRWLDPERQCSIS